MEKLLSCPICQDPFTHAVEVQCCSKCYCLGCIEKWIIDAKTGENATCPSCRTVLTPGAWKENRPLQALADDLPATCENASNGCTASITRGIIKEHQSKCEYALITCSSDGCPEKPLRKNLDSHLEGCTYKQMTCVLGCDERFRASNLQLHFETCPLFQLRCQLCGHSVLRKDLAQHSTSCSYGSSCPLAEFGCAEKNISDLETHLAQNMSSHFVFACLAIRRLQDANQSLQDKVEVLSKALLENSQRTLPVPLAPVAAVTVPSPAPIDEIEQTKQQIRRSNGTEAVSTNLASSTSDTLLKPSSGSKKLDMKDESANYDAQLPPSTSLEIGLKLVSALPPEFQSLYSKLVNKPQLMIESMVMNQRFDCLQALYEFMPAVFREEMFFVYAKKALSLPNTNYEAQMKVGLETIRGPVQSAEATTTILTGDASYDDSLRKKHSFSDVPNASLALQFLSYCGEIQAAYFTVQLCESYEGFVTGFVSLDLNLRVVEALKKMLQFGKVLFLNHPVEAHSGIIALIDSFLSQLDIMFQIIQSKKPLQVSFADFGDQNKARTLRDKLIEHAEFQIARDLCLRTNIPAEVVTVAWGLQHLKSGKFSEARALLVPILTPANRSRSSSTSALARPSMASLTRNIDTQNVIDNIIQILDSPKSPGNTAASNFTRSTSGTLTRAPSLSSTSSSNASLLVAGQRRTVSGILPINGSSGSSSKPSTSSANTPDKRFSIESISTSKELAPITLTAEVEECLFYLEKFGSNLSILKFYMKHTLLEQACRLVLENKIEAETFLERIVIPCTDNSLLGELKTSLERVDPQLVKSQPYLLATCKYLNEQKAFKTLVTFQVFMRDYARAALTCIRVFMDTTDQNYRMKCLEIAKDYFGEAGKILEQKTEDSIIPSAMSASDMASYLMKIDIQIEVLKVLLPMLSKLEVTLKIPNLSEYTLFGPPAQRTTLTWILMVHNLDLGLKVLSETIKRDEWPAVFTNAGIYAARHFSVTQASQLIDNVKAAGADSEWVDLLLKAETEVLAKEKKDSKTSEKMAKMISQPRLRCMALIDAGKLKSAYLEAVKLEDPLALIALILPRAQADNDASVVKLCSNFVNQHTTQ